jgi:hypothetical protein
MRARRHVTRPQEQPFRFCHWLILPSSFSARRCCGCGLRVKVSYTLSESGSGFARAQHGMRSRKRTRRRASGRDESIAASSDGKLPPLLEEAAPLHKPPQKVDAGNLVRFSVACETEAGVSRGTWRHSGS